MGEFINTIDELGDEVVLGKIIDGTIEELNDNVIKTIPRYGFGLCSALKRVDFPSVTSVDKYGFSSCTGLTDVNLPSATSLGNNAFLQCSSLRNVNLPLITTINSEVFYSSGLIDVTLPLVRTVDNKSFYSCAGLRIVDLPVATKIAYNVFQKCTKLAALVLRSTTLCTLSSTTSFSESGVSADVGYIYVPRALMESYKTATNWTYYSTKFRALEDYTLDGTITGELNRDHLDIRDAMELEDDWATIMTACDDGSYAQKYKIGDWKPLDLGSEGVVNMQIVAMDMDTLADGSGTAAVSWVSKEVLYTDKAMNNRSDATGGWESCAVRSYMKEEIKPRLSSEILNSIVDVVKTQTSYDGSTTVSQTTIDDIWIPGYAEVFGTGGMYTKLYFDNNSRLKPRSGSDNCAWWLRDVYNSTYYRIISTSGATSTITPTSKRFIALGFCTGVSK